MRAQTALAAKWEERGCHGRGSLRGVQGDGYRYDDERLLAAGGDRPGSGSGGLGLVGDSACLRALIFSFKYIS
jgi:hypothetical protein